MGQKNGPYKEDFPVGTLVRLAERSVLERFMRPQWKYHNPLKEPQLAFAGQTAVVIDVGFYHGSDELYKLREPHEKDDLPIDISEGIPGLWHEACLLAP